MEEYLMKMLVCGDRNIESFRSHHTSPQLRQLALSAFYSAAAPHSGPIALLYRKYDEKHIKVPQGFDNSILIFSCRGELLKIIPFDLKERILIFQFTQEESLLVVYATGTYFLIDIATAAKHEGNYLGDGEEGKAKSRCMGAQLIHDKLVILRDKTLGIVQELKDKWKPLPAIKLHPQFAVFQTIPNANGQLQMVYINGAYEIQKFSIKGKTQTLFFHPELRTLAPLLVAVSYKEGQLVLIFTDFLLWIDCPSQKEVKPKQTSSGISGGKVVVTGSTLSEKSLQAIKMMFGERMVAFEKFRVDKQDPMTKTSSPRKYRQFYTIGWLGDVCYFSDRRHLFLISKHHTLCDIPATESGYLLAPGQNILRLIDQHTYVLRVINDPIYLTLSGHQETVQSCLKTSTQHEVELYQQFRQLLTIYDNVIEKRPNSIEQLKELEMSAKEIYQHLLKAVQQALDAGLQLKILKIAEWVLSLFHVKGDLKDLLNRLRVVNGLKYEHLNRWLTLDEFQTLRNERFLLMLLRSNMHYVADLIFEDSTSKKKIFLHWAKCKIQKQTSLTAVEQIQSRYQDMYRDLQSKFVFTELALYALHKPTPLYDLALRLAENQPNPARKCIVFLLVFRSRRSLDLIDKLLDFAEQSMCTTAISRTLSTLRQLKEEIPGTVWLQLLPKKPFLQSFYLRLLKAENNQQELQKYMEINKKYADLAYISLSAQLKSAHDKSFRAALELLQSQYSKILPNLTDQAARCKQRENISRLRELKERSTPLSQEDVVQVSKDEELEFLGELAVNRDKNLGLALRLFRKIQSEKIYQILKSKGRVRDSLQVAFERRNKAKLQELMEEVEEPQIVQYGRQLLQELSLAR